VIQNDTGMARFLSKFAVSNFRVPRWEIEIDKAKTEACLRKQLKRLA